MALRSSGRITIRFSRMAWSWPSKRTLADEAMLPVVRASFVASARTYGARRIWRDVLAESFSCGLHKIEHLMRANALRARPRRRALPKDDGQRLVAGIAPNTLDRQFTAQQPNRKWIADFTYIWTAEGWLYVAAVIERFYNPVRRHSTIGYISPVEFERKAGLA